MKKFVTKTYFKKIQAHIAMKIFVTKTISYKILLHLATKYVVTKTIFVAAKTYFLFLFFSWL